RRHTSSTRDWSSDVCSSDLVGWEDRAHPHEVEVGEMGVPQRHLETREFFPVPTDALGEKGLGGHEHSRLDQPVTSFQLSYHTAAPTATGGSGSPVRSAVACSTCSMTAAGDGPVSTTSTRDCPRSLPRTTSM